LEAAGHGTDPEGPMFRPYSHNLRQQEMRRPMDPDAIDRMLRKHGNAIGLDRGGFRAFHACHLHYHGP
jgi:hypothetical protein